MGGTIVQKFGGTCVTTAGRMRSVAARVQRARLDGENPVVVVSAMGRTTDALRTLAGEFRPDSNAARRRELDTILATGEQLSAAMVALALEDRGISAFSLTGAAAGIMTDARHGNARIRAVDATRVRRALTAGLTPVVAGFQGIAAHGHTTTLGRGGSDTTAVALAHALGAGRCDIYTDVNGIYSADPHALSGARKHDRLNHWSALRLALAGAAVLHPRAVALAGRYGLPLRVLSPGNGRNDNGTLITKDAETMEEPYITGIFATVDTAGLVLDGPASWPNTARVLAALSGAAIPVKAMTESTAAGKRRLIAYVPAETAGEATRVIRDLSPPPIAIRVEAAGTRISVVGSGLLMYEGPLESAMESLRTAGIEPKSTRCTDVEIAIDVEPEVVDTAIRILHRSLVEDGEPKRKRT